MSVKRICLWSGPRNVSTALMYSFAQRGDTRVVDEPLYGHYLRASGAQHPGFQEVLETMDTDGDRVMRELMQRISGRPVLFMKHMAHHLTELDRGFLRDTLNVLLVRDPQQMLPSLIHQIPQPNLRDTGLAIQADLLRDLLAMGQQPPVLDAREVLLNPASVLKQLCDRLDLPSEDNMLHWEAGPLKEDGVWAKYWYHNVHLSTGFQVYREKNDPSPAALQPLLAECLPHYEFLAGFALR